MKVIFNVFIILLFACGIAPLANMLLILMGYPSLLPSAPTKPDETDPMARMGQMGDFFGGHTAAFSGLLSACVIIHFSLQQLKIAKQTADLTSISKIYDHYNDAYSTHGKEQNHILSGIAHGHRRWAIRESFSLIDPDGALERERVSQVNADFEQLVKLADEPDVVKNYSLIAIICGSLLLDKRLIARKRIALWSLYETLRRSSVELNDPNSREAQVLANQLRLLHRRFNGGFSW